MLSDPYDDPRNLESYLAQWHLPSLLHLKTLGIIPPEGWCSALTTFEYEFSEDVGTQNLKLMLQTLDRSPHLEKLAIKARDPILFGIENESFRLSTTHRALKHLSIELAAASHVELVTVLVSNIDVPNLETLSIVLGLSSEDAEDWIPHADPVVHSSFSPSSLNLRLPYDVADHAVMAYIGKLVPNLEHLSLDCQGMELPAVELQRWQHLRSMRFFRCDLFDGYALRNLINGWREDLSVQDAGSRWSRFEMLEVSNCRCISDTPHIVSDLRLALGHKFVFKE